MTIRFIKYVGAMVYIFMSPESLLAILGLIVHEGLFLYIPKFSGADGANFLGTTKFADVVVRVLSYLGSFPRKNISLTVYVNFFRCHL